MTKCLIVHPFTCQYQPFTRLNTKTQVLLIFTWLCSKTLCNPVVTPEASVNQFEHGLPPKNHSGLTPHTSKSQMKTFRPPLQTNAFLTICFVLQVIRRPHPWRNSVNTSHKAFFTPILLSNLFKQRSEIKHTVKRQAEETWNWMIYCWNRQ